MTTVPANEFSNPIAELFGSVPEPAPPREPSYGAVHRDKIDALIGELADELIGKIGELRHMLDDVEQRVVESAADTKISLQDHVIVCGRFHQEIASLRKLVEGIARSTS
jgi:hypothetical protein